MVATCVTPIKARVMRLIKLDQCGVPVTGAESAMVVTNGFISIAVTPEYAEGEEFTQRNADGSLCVNQQDPAEFTRATLAVSLCGIDPDLMVIATGERLLTTGGPTGTGTGVAYGEGALNTRFSLEVWQPIAGAGACSATGAQQFVYWAFMNVGNTQLTEFTFENGVFNIGFQGSTFAAFPGWEDIIPTPVNFEGDIEAGDHFLHNITTNTPPTPACGAVPLAA